VLSVLRETVESRPADSNRPYALARIDKHQAALVKTQR
jgi:hypothetical protein